MFSDISVVDGLTIGGLRFSHDKALRIRSFSYGPGLGVEKKADIMTSSDAIAAVSSRLGRVIFFCQKRGYGFIEDVEDAAISFVHYTSLALKAPGWRGLYGGEYVQYGRKNEEDGRTIAETVRGVCGGPLMCEHKAPPPNA